MDFFSYLYPQEWVSQIVVGIQVAAFLLWIISLLYFWMRDVRLRNAVEHFDISDLRLGTGKADGDLFSRVDLKKPGGLDIPSKALRYHLRTLDAFGKTGKTLDVESLIRNTTNRLTLNNAWLRSTLSLFIILGLLGTLWGLASSLDQLSSMTGTESQITNETLGLGLSTLLGKLGGAFAPSIFGVFFTITGVLMFALYIRTASMPLAAAVERQTVTYWAPGMVRNESDAAVMMRKNIEAAVQVGSAAQSIGTNVEKLVWTLNESLPAVISALTDSIGEISEKLRNEATGLSDEILNARESLKALTTASENLNGFSETFRKSVEKLYPFSDAAELRAIYEKLLARSDKILQNHDAFQETVLGELANITEQKALFNSGLDKFQKSVSTASNSIVDEIGGTSAAAKDAFSRLSEQNENVIRELVDQVGSPIAAILEPIPGSMEGFNREVRRINTPLEGVKDSIASSSLKVVEYAAQRMNNIEDKLQAQVTNLDALASSINNLVPKVEVLSERIDGFNTKTTTFSETIDRFGGATVNMANMFQQFEQKADEVIRATKVVQRPAVRPPSENRVQEKKGILRQIKNKLFGK